ncbi:MAG: 30S ribosomal protein S12 methylthiotransferase RimO [Flavobacteriales bacterium]|nr:30S ribosomal protein S12 methylthiotransferase RimO [Flavobacteriales bacterium]
MRSKYRKKNKINVITLGCSKNIYDSEVLMGQLSANSIDVSHESSNNDANIIVVNTCGFIDSAKEESINTILEQSHNKRNGRIDKLFVTGCLSERYKSDLKTEIPEVDEYFGTKDLPLLLKRLGADYKQELIGERCLTTPQHYAYLKISEGCDRKCSFCAIPIMRGKHRSFPIQDLVAEAKNLAEKGVKELILIGQDLTYYGLDIYKDRSLSQLILQLAKVEGIHWIRLHYAFPTGFPKDVLQVMRDNPKVCNYIDIPLQHISNNVLKSMRRGTNSNKTKELIKYFRSQVPRVAIRTTLIVGYPGETEEDFKELLNFVKESKFDRLGVFTYSHEKDTHAYKLNDNISEEVKQQRADDIMEAQLSISYELNKKKIGNVYNVLFDRKVGDYFIGRTEHDSPDVDNEVLVNANKFYVRLGDFAKVKIVKIDNYDLFGELIS